MPYFNDILAKQPFVAVDTFSLADITLWAALDFADAIRLPVDPELKALAAWRAKVNDLPAVKNRSGQAILPEDLARFGA
jgi:glutathione S-transferase